MMKILLAVFWLVWGTVIVLLLILAFNIIIYIGICLWNYLKILYCRVRKDRIAEISLSGPIQLYKTRTECTGYTANNRGISYHYRYRKTAAGTARNIRIRFNSGRKMTVFLKEKSSLYRCLLGMT